MPEFIAATTDHFSVIKELWQEGFPEDTAEDMEAFFAHMFKKATCLLCREGDEFVSMAFLIPAEIGADTWWYVYAAATRRTRRGKGYFAALLREAARRAAEQNVAGLFLRPATQSLFLYYERCGFHSAFAADTITCNAKGLYSAVSWKRILSDYGKERNSRLESMGVDFVRWSDEAAEYGRFLAEQSGGGAFACEEGVALCEYAGDRLVVRELLCERACAERLLASLSRLFPCRSVQTVLPSTFEKTTNFQGMVYPCYGNKVPDTCYLGLTFE